MAVRRFIVDSGGTSRLIRRRFVVDSGGTSRLIKRRFVIDTGGTARLTYQGVTITLPNDTVTDAAIAPTNAIANFILNTNGNRQHQTSGGTSTVGAWIDPTSEAGSYEARGTVLSGSFTTGTFGSWLALSSSRTWGITRSTNGTSVASMTLEIREASTGTVMGTATISFSATRDP